VADSNKTVYRLFVDEFFLETFDSKSAAILAFESFVFKPYMDALYLYQRNYLDSGKRDDLLIKSRENQFPLFSKKGGDCPG
jgi:hypothetical protein